MYVMCQPASEMDPDLLLSTSPWDPLRSSRDCSVGSTEYTAGPRCHPRIRLLKTRPQITAQPSPNSCCVFQWGIFLWISRMACFQQVTTTNWPWQCPWRKALRFLIIPSQEDPGDGEKWGFFCSGGKIFEFWVILRKQDAGEQQSWASSPPWSPSGFAPPRWVRVRVREPSTLQGQGSLPRKWEQSNSCFLLLCDQYLT